MNNKQLFLEKKKDFQKDGILEPMLYGIFGLNEPFIMEEYITCENGFGDFILSMCYCDEGCNCKDECYCNNDDDECSCKNGCNCFENRQSKGNYKCGYCNGIIKGNILICFENKIKKGRKSNIKIFTLFYIRKRTYLEAIIEKTVIKQISFKILLKVSNLNFDVIHEIMKYL